MADATRILSAGIDGRSVPVPTREAPLQWHVRGLQYTASGYGRKIPTPYMVQLPGSPRWRRVYCAIFGNAGTCYVEGKRTAEGKRGPWVVISD